MKSFLLTILFLISPTFIFSQTDNDKIILFDSLSRETSENIHHLRKIKDYYSPKNIEEYVIEDYYKSGKIEMIGKSKNKDIIMRHGDFKFYYENGNKKKIMRYENGVPVGKVYLWHENGLMKATGEYIPLKEKEEPYELKIYQYWDEEKTQKVIDGNGIYVSDEEYRLCTTVGNLKNGSKDGEWTGKDDNLKIAFKETYNNGKLISGESIDSLGIKHNYSKVRQSPEPLGGMEKFMKYIAVKYRIPENVNILADSRINLTFIVDTDGNPTKVTITKSLRKDFDDEAIRVVKAYKNWKTGLLRGIPVKVQYTLPLNLKKNI